MYGCIYTAVLFWLWTWTNILILFKVLSMLPGNTVSPFPIVIKVTYFRVNSYFKMVRITEQLIRKKSEHNECVIGTLEELSLHQEDVDKIEHINNWCKGLQILYLQSNLISKIENLNKLKNLQYLNLAINNIEKIENLEKCESLEKLDLTLNFIGDIESVYSLKGNIHLKYLFLTGNPCTDYNEYRNYIIAKLPQLLELDNMEIRRSERIKALQILDETEILVKKGYEDYKVFRAEQRTRLSHPDECLEDEEFWKTTSEHAPETRIEIARRKRKHKNEESKPEQKCLQLFSKDGRPLNINQAKLDFKFEDTDPKEFVLDVTIYRYLDTNLIDVDLQPIVVRISIKGKTFQFVLPEEIYVDKSTAQRSQITGHLVIKMPRVNYKKPLEIKSYENVSRKRSVNRIKFLEVGKTESLDYSKIVENNNIIVDSDIPPLEYG